jgi:rod shape-determining protein MreC
LGLALFFLNGESQTAKTARNGIRQISFGVYDIISYPSFILKDISDSLSYYLNAVKRNRYLEHENIILRNKMQILQIQMEENAQLRRLLNVHTQTATNYVTARIISYSSSLHGESFIVNVGRKHSVQEGQAVVNERGLIGKVTDVTYSTARVLALSDINSRIPALLSKSRYKCIAAGNKADNLRLLYLEENASVQDDELVITSGEGGVFPYGLIIGKVIQVGDKLMVSPAVDLNQVEFVKVLAIAE